MINISPSNPNTAILNQALKLQKEGQRLILAGYASAPADSREGRAVTAWTFERQRLAQREPTNLIDGLILLHFAAQALEAIPASIENGATEAACVLTVEVSSALTSLETFLIKSTGKTPSDFGLFHNYFPEALH